MVIRRTNTKDNLLVGFRQLLVGILEGIYFLLICSFQVSNALIELDFILLENDFLLFELFDLLSRPVEHRR